MSQPEIIDSCEGCGACCLHVGSPMCYPIMMQWLDDQNHYELNCMGDASKADLDRVRALSDELKQELHDFSEARAEDESIAEDPCIWLNMYTRECKHHDIRPVCRDFEIGDESCRSFRED